jgi:crotonobetainyl-CoA:carnitine CoA-transferase CaiB-like acyl-CoA transferase
MPGGETEYFVGVHRNKKGVVLDLKTAEGKQLFLDMAAKADVVLENFRVGTLKKLGIDYETAKLRNPGIIYCSVSGFGQDGPYRDRPAMDLILQAESGMISVTGEEGRRGVRTGTSIADQTAGMNAAFGILLALRHKDKTGQGQQVDVSMMEGQIALLGTMITAYCNGGVVPAPMGTAYKALLPYQTFRTRTGDLATAVGSDKLWKAFCPLIGCPELANDPRFATNHDRNRNREPLLKKLEEVFLTRSYEEWEPILVKGGIPVGRVNNLAQVNEHPQVRARGSLLDMQHPTAGKVRMAGPAVRLTATPGTVRTPAPHLGEHTEEVMKDLLGLDGKAIAELREKGAFGKAG